MIIIIFEAAHTVGQLEGKVCQKIPAKISVGLYPPPPPPHFFFFLGGGGVVDER